MMKRFFTFLCLICLVSLSCGLLSGGAPTVSPTHTELASPPKLPTASPQAAGTATSLPDSLYFPLLADSSDGMTAQDWLEATLGGMSVEQKIGQLIITGIDGDEVTPQTCQFIAQLRPAGISLERANMPNPEKLRLFTTGLQECARAAGMPPLLITLAHEGEYVDRFQQGTTTFPSALALGAVGDPNVAYQAALASGHELGYSGVNLILGPVADVLTNFDNEVISQRTYGGDTSQVSQYVSQAVNGYLDAGLIPVLKHFPGHGGVSGDSHRELPVDRADLDRLRQVYLPPFQSGIQAGAPVVMISHVSYPVLDNGAEIPATLSKEVVRLLREEMGFDGVIISDAMRMKAVTQVMTTAEASLQAVQAGIDLILATIPKDAQDTYDWLMDGYNQGRLTDEQIDDAVRRVLALKAWRNSTLPQPGTAAPEWDANQQLAFQTGERAVALLKDSTDMVPIPDDLKRVMVIGPGEDWELYPALDAALKESGHAPAFFHYPPPWDGKVQDEEMLRDLPARAAKYDAILYFTWQAHLNKLDINDTWQIELAENLRSTSTPLIIVAIKSPTDILEFPEVDTYLAMFGTTPGQEQALIEALVGLTQLQGQNPLPGLMP